MELTEQDLLSAKERLADIKAEQDSLRIKELALRNHIADCFHTGVEGSKTVTVGETKLTVKRTLNYSITQSDAERLKQEHPEIATCALSWSPKVKVSGYKDHSDVMNEFITTKPGPPSVDFN
jgi:hypothetical protein